MNSLMLINRFQVPTSLFNKLLIISLFFYIPFQFFFRYFNFDEYQNILRLFLHIFLIYIFLITKKINKIFLFCFFLIFCLLNYIKLDQYFFVYTTAGFISYSTFLVFFINRNLLLDIIKNGYFIQTVSLLSILILFFLGSYATFYNNDVQRFSSPRLFEDYPLTNPNTIAVFLGICIYFIFSVIRFKNKIFSFKDLIFCQVFSIICLYILTLSYSRQGCLITNIIFWIFFTESFLHKNNFKERVFYLFNFFMSLTVTIYVFAFRGDFINQQFSGRYQSITNYSIQSDISILSENLLNKIDTLVVIFGKIFGASTNFVISFDKLFKLGGVRYIPSADNMFLSSLNNGGMFLTVVILFLFIKLIQPQRINISTTIIMFLHYLILTILCFGHVFNENVVVFLLFCMTLFLKKFNISNIN